MNVLDRWVLPRLWRENWMLHRELKDARQRLNAVPALRRELAETRQKLLGEQLRNSYKQPGHR